MSKLSVGVIFGGASSEYEISLRSAASVIGQMKEELYDKVLNAYEEKLAENEAESENEAHGMEQSM